LFILVLLFINYVINWVIENQSCLTHGICFFEDMYVQRFFVSSLKRYRGERKDCLVYCLLSETIYF